MIVEKTRLFRMANDIFLLRQVVDLPAAVRGLSLIFVHALTQNYSNVPFVASYLVVSTSWQAISQKAAEARQ